MQSLRYVFGSMLGVASVPPPWAVMACRAMLALAFVAVQGSLVLASDAAEATQGGEKGSILTFQPNLAIWSFLVFLVLLFILWKYAWTPLTQALDRREQHMQNCMRDAEKARDEAQKYLTEYRERMKLAADEVRAILEEARRDAQTTALDIRKAAEQEAEAARQRAFRDISSARDQALNEIMTKSAEMSVAIASKLLPRELGADDHRRLFDIAMQELPRPNGQSVSA